MHQGLYPNLARWWLSLKDFTFKRVDPGFLLFLLFLLNYRISFKILALVGIYIFYPKIKIKKDPIGFFYLSMILLALANLFYVSNDLSKNHIIVVGVSCLFWLACFLSYNQVKLWIERTSEARIVDTLKMLVILNFIVSCFDLLQIMFINKTLNPFTQIVGPPYGISSGDLIGGIYGEMHLVNTILSCILAIFFIYRGSFLFVLLNLLPFLLTGSNLGTIITVGLLLLVLVLKKDIVVRYLSLFSIAIICIFYIKVTPLNSSYMLKTLSNVKDQLVPKKNKKIVSGDMVNKETILYKKKPSKEELIRAFVLYKKRKHGDSLPAVELKEQTEVLSKLYNYENDLELVAQKDEAYIIYRKDSLQKSKNNQLFYEYGNLKKFNLSAESGKITSFKQTIEFLQSDLKYTFFGAGAGSFSSRLAFITSRIVDDSRILVAIPFYESVAFAENHKAIFKYLMFLDDETHSITNLPFSWYNQVLGEYGLIGLVLFLFLYLGRFVFNIRMMTFGRVVLLAMITFFIFDYWFERLSVVVLFELIMLFDLKFSKHPRAEG